MNPITACRPASLHPDGNASSPEDPRVLQAVEEYLAALEAGQAPGREEFLGRHAAFAGRLGEYLDGLEMIHRAGSAAGPGSDPEAAADDLAGAEPLGDFLLVRELGRGGMGVVYKAVQRSLNRRVALKVLPFAAALDAKQLQRFKNEAQAAACLHHTNIVPVYGVGCERGVHYYAMQFIEGQSLAQLLAELRRKDEGRRTKSALSDPAAQTELRHSTLDLLSSLGMRHASFRTMAQLALQSAEALAHAHEEGVVHRDIKPANLLVDVKGKLWITDFGLAHCQNQVGLTMSGDLVGTLRYMSPEQALAKRVPIDHRTDIYSLGVTLYELLSLEPAYPGTDRQELLRQIAFEEPQPLRRRNKSIPAELETIVQKAMEKNPAERYATAQELADDLRRFLEEKPIQAKRPTLLQRARKWSRRHPSVVWAGTILLTLAAIGSAVGTLLIARERDVAKANYVQAQVNLETAYQILDEIYLTRAEKYLPQEKSLTPQDRQFLEQTLTFYERFANQHGEDPKVRLKTAQAYLRVAAIQEKLGQAAKAQVAYRQALAVSAELHAAFPEDPDYRQILARSYSSLYGLLGLLPAPGGSQAREEAYAEALRLQEELVREFPENREYQRELGLTFFRIGSWRMGILHKHPDSRVDAEGPVRRAVAIREKLVVENPSVFLYRQELGMSLGNLGNFLSWTNKHQEAEKVLCRNLELRQKLVDDFPAEPEVRHYLADAYSDMGVFQARTGHRKEAEQSYRLELALRKKLVAEFPSVVVYKRRLLTASMNLSNHLRNKASLDEVDEAIAILQESVRANMGDAESCAGLGYALWKRSRWDEAVAAFRKQVELDPQDSLAFFNLGVNLAEKGALDEAITAYRAALRLKPDYALAYSKLAWAYGHKGAPEESIAAYKEALRLLPGNANLQNNVGLALWSNDCLDEAIVAYQEALCLQPDHAAALLNLGQAFKEKGLLDEAEAAFQRATALLEKLAKDRPAEPGQRRPWALSLLRLGELHRDTARSPEADHELRQAHALLQKLVSESPKNSDNASYLALVLRVQAQLCLDRAELAEARRLFSEALARQKTALELRGNTSALYQQGRVAIHALELADTLLQSPTEPGLAEQVEALLNEAVRSSVSDRSAQNALAWFLATCPEPRFHDPQRAVELAKRLVEQGPQKAAYWRTLGAALYGIGDGNAAIAALEKAMQLQNGGDGTERFFLAMAYERMGNQEQARACYREAVQWMDKHKPQHAELRRLRTKTATLLGGKEQD